MTHSLGDEHVWQHRTSQLLMQLGAWRHCHQDMSSQTGFLLPLTVIDIIFLRAYRGAGCHQLSSCSFSGRFHRWMWNSVLQNHKSERRRNVQTLTACGLSVDTLRLLLWKHGIIFTSFLFLKLIGNKKWEKNNKYKKCCHSSLDKRCFYVSK